MKRNEDAIIPSVGCMMQNIALSLDTPQQWAIAQWAMMKAMVWEYVNSKPSLFYSDEQRTALRVSSTIPAHTAIWLAKYVGEETFMGGAYDAKVRTPIDTFIKCHVTTLAYKYLVIQVLTIQADQYPGPNFIINCNQDFWGPVFSMIWPTKRVVRWPANKNIPNAEALTAFHRRCLSTVKG
jgi:hypothetical protein